MELPKSIVRLPAVVSTVELTELLKTSQSDSMVGPFVQIELLFVPEVSEYSE